jgi:hypothetical protein
MSHGGHPTQSANPLEHATDDWFSHNQEFLPVIRVPDIRIAKSSASYSFWSIAKRTLASA